MVAFAPAARPRQQAAADRRFLVHAGLALALAAFLLAGPSLGWKIDTIHLLATASLYALTTIGVNIVFGFAGQITLGPAATFAVGAYVGAVLSVKEHWNPFVVVVPAIALALVVGLVIGMPALRVGGFYLAMVTAIAALAVPSTAASLHSITGGSDGIAARQFSIGRHIFSDATGYRIIIVATLLAAFVAANISRSSWGRWFRCLQVNEAGTSALGVSVYSAKVIAFAWSAVFGGVAGALFAPFEIVISPSQFGFDLSTAFFVALVVGGLGAAWGPVLGIALYYVAPEYLLPKSLIGLKQQLIFACLLIVIVVLLPDGLASGFDRLWQAATRRFRRGDAVPIASGAAVPATSSTSALHAAADRTRTELPRLLARAAGQDQSRPALVARDVTVRFGGIVALDGAGIVARPGQITALIGPNGSGKTTLLNVCSGFQTPSGGRVELAGVDVTRRSPHLRARAGLARTFQHPVVFTDLTGAENVMAGELADRPSSVAAAFRLPSSRRHERAAAERAEAMLHALGVEQLVERPAAKSSLADSRILDLARALALDPLVLLLDEPAAGLGLDDIAVLEALVRATADAGVAVVLVEHDVAFVARLADRVFALDLGRVIAEGTPAEVRSDPEVLRSYFGDVEHQAVASSPSEARHAEL